MYERVALDPELLLAHSGWVRSLVRGLLQDEALADEVVQETWLAALERPPRAHSTAGLRAWLASVARNLALRARRRELVRPAIERAAARSEARPGETDEVARMQLQQRLAGAVLALEEPYRSAVILRHLDGLSYAELARRQACTAAAARQRVARGLAQLRARLTAEFGDRASWSALFVRAFGTGNGSAALAAGGIVMGMKSVAAVTTVLVVLAWWTWYERRAPETTSPAVAAHSAAVLQPEAEPTARPELERAEPVELASSAARESVSVPTLVRGVVRDARGQPLSGARIAHVDAADVEAVSDAKGRFEFSLSEAHARFEVACEGFVGRELELVAGEDTEVALQALPALTGRLRTPSGEAAPLPGRVMIEIHAGPRTGLVRRYAQGRGDATVASVAEGELDAQGNFRFEGLPVGRLVKLWGRAAGFAPCELSVDRALEPDQTLSQDLELVPGVVLTGIVRDARTREPLEGAEVWVEGLDPASDALLPRTTSDSAGHFRLAGVTRETRARSDGELLLGFLLLASAPDHATSPVQISWATPVANDEYAFELLLEPSGASLFGRVLLPDGSPAAHASVIGVAAQGALQYVSADENGEFALEGLGAGKLALMLESEAGCLDTSLELEAGEARTADFRLERGAATLTGAVLDLAGQPVAGLEVRAQYVFRANGISIGRGERTVRTDAEGRYAFDALLSGSSSVALACEGTSTPCALPVQSSLELHAGANEPVDFVVGPCFTLEGRVETSGSTEGLVLQALDPASGGWCGSATVGADGFFRFDPLLAREHEVVLSRGTVVLQRVFLGPDAPGGTVLVVPP
ncbi:MAG: sigma-70 family RNA polymerase sigma factor [Planctomycetota bacterium]